MIPVSFVAEYAFCPRSAYYLLTDIPRYRDENEYIQNGRFVHQKVDKGYTFHKKAKKIVSSLHVFSEKFGLSGKVDYVEFFEDGEIVPVEIKRGKKRNSKMHQMQLALLGLCLKDMFPKLEVARGAVFFSGDRQKMWIPLTDDVLLAAVNLANEVNQKDQVGLDPRNFPMRKTLGCKGCCFYHLCYF